MSLNLGLSFSHPDAISNFVQYARIDNLNGANPVFTTVVPNPITSPAVIATNVPAGQYQIQATPVYADGRICQPTVKFTPACPGLTSISGYISNNNLIVSYLAPSDVPKVRITVGYPNGGSFVANYVNTGTDIVIALPPGLFGNYTINGQSVCDESSGFYSALSSTVNVSVQTPTAGTFTLGNSQTTICNGTSGTFYTGGSFGQGAVLYTDSTLSTAVNGYSFLIYNGAIYNLDPSSGIIGTPTGGTCGATITGTTGLSAGTPTGSGFINGTPGAAIYFTIVATGPSGGTHTLQINIPGVSLINSVTNSTYLGTFIMPSSGQVAWSALFTTTDGSGSGTISLL